MNKRIKNMWLKALRSGEYIQAKEQLCSPLTYHRLGSDEEREYGFCCLGVLENLYCLERNLEFTVGRQQDGAHSRACAKWSGLDTDETSWNPQEVKMKIDYGNWMKPQYEFVPVFRYLQEKNDAGWSFKRIANWIEKRL